MLIDLQFHSTYSDGYLSPTDVVKFCVERGIKIASLTDHNTISGLIEFEKACRKYKVKYIPGLELYVKLNGKKFNLLWYNFDDAHPDLHALLRDSQMRRRARVRSVLEELSVKSGFVLDVDKIVDKYNHYVPINHVVDDLIHSSYNKKIVSRILKTKDFRESDIIHEFFRNKKYGMLRESYINFDRIIKMRKEVGGQLIYNHPAKYGHIDEKFVKKLKEKGLDGIEMLSPHHNLGAIMYIQFLAKKYNLITTGGSDYHRSEGDRALLQNSLEYFKIDSKYLRNINKVIKKK